MALQIAYSLLLALSWNAQYVNAQDTSPQAPTQPNISKDCNKYYTVKSGQGCSDVETKFGITHANFIKWNPDVSDDCSKNFWADYSYCVGVGAKATTTSTTKPPTTTSTTSKAPITTSSSTGQTTSKPTSSSSTTNATYSIREPMKTWNVTSPSIATTYPPKPIQTGQASNCIDWYLVGIGDTCASIIGYATWMTAGDFYAANPAVGADCSGLFINYWVCIRTRPLSSTAAFQYTVNKTTASIPSSTPWKSTAYPTANSSFVASPTAGALPTDCREFYKAQPDDTCKNVPLIAAGLVTEQQFYAWNPALKSACNGMWVNYYYCALAGSAQPTAPKTTTRPTALPAGQVTNCTAWYKASGYESCSDIATLFGTFSSANFISWNPSVGNSCNNIKADVNYCVAIPGTPATRTSSSSMTTPTSTPTQSGVASNCKTFWLVSSTDTCTTIASKNGISSSDFLKWNPAVGSDCKGLKPDTYVCVGVK